MSLALPQWMCLLLSSLVLYWLLHAPKQKLNIPTVRYSCLLPDWINRCLFFFTAPAQIQYGYDKYKDMPFRVLRPDNDLIVLPRRYLEEIRQMPSSQASLIDAQFNNILGEYTNVLRHSELPAHTVAKKLTPAISRILPRVLDELHTGFTTKIPTCKDWTTIALYPLIQRLITRVTSCIIFDDETLAHNKKWLSVLSNYSTDVGLTIIILRPVPAILRPLVAHFLPSVRRMNESLRWFQEELIVPTIAARRALDDKAQKPDDFFQWMLDCAETEYDQDPRNLAQALIIISALGMLHTTTMLLTHTLYDILVRPEYIPVLREEIENTLVDGWKSATPAVFAAQVKLDSVLRESLRLNPTSEVSTQRITQTTLTLSSNLVIPAGTHICFPAGPMSRDPDLVSNEPATYDPFRWCPTTNPNATNPGTGSGNRLVSISPVNTHFGYGRLACPGRFFASNTMKAILSRLLAEYDLVLVGGKRPANIWLGEQIMPAMGGMVQIRERQVS